MEWMELKTEILYTKMRDAMDTSNNRVAAEDALNDIKGKMDDLAASGADAHELHQMVNDTIAQYGEDFPEVGKVLQPIADELSDREKPVPGVQQQTPSNNLPGVRSGNVTGNSGGSAPKPAPLTAPRSVKISSDDAKRWTQQISDKVDTLGKQDQLGMIHLQDFNAQLNRTKDMASALMASADKAADNIVAHIS
jgi:hypothetical protein